MNFSRDFSCCHLDAAWVAIGAFDGMHLGHQFLLRGMVKGAHDLGLPAVVINFYPQPTVVFRSLESDFYLTDLETRKSLIESMGVDYLITIPFTREFGQTTAEDFMRQVKDRLNVRSLWVGSDFVLGRNREGNVARLRQIGAMLNFHVEEVLPVEQAGEVISSSVIRDALRVGDIAKANRMLGRAFTLRGPVIHGAERGRTIGYPTANLGVDPLTIHLRHGVYRTHVELEGVSYSGVTNVGVNPTFVHAKNPPLSVETFILDFNQMIYDKILVVKFIQFMRSEVSFGSVDALVEAISADVDAVRGFENHAPKTTGISA
ncbi:MAG: riboflavin biosynthesis protein RibF [Anaerolineaceae bacterium]|nr:riboflavin biosynthesis protein RibF [Anaerolineaceae bacterium]